MLSLLTLQAIELFEVLGCLDFNQVPAHNFLDDATGEIISELRMGKVGSVGCYSPDALATGFLLCTMAITIAFTV